MEPKPVQPPEIEIVFHDDVRYYEVGMKKVEDIAELLAGPHEPFPRVEPQQEEVKDDA